VDRPILPPIIFKASATKTPEWFWLGRVLLIHLVKLHKKWVASASVYYIEECNPMRRNSTEW